MDEEGGQKPAASPTRKKFVIPLDEDEVPPPGVGLGDEGTARRLGGGRSAEKGGQDGAFGTTVWVRKCWGLGHLEKTVLCPLQVSFSLPVKCHGQER